MVTAPVRSTPTSSRLEQVIFAQRNALLARDEATARAILRAIETARKRLHPLIMQAQEAIDQMDDPSASRVFTLERWKRLEAQLIQQLDELARTTGLRLTRDQRAAIAQAQEDAKALAVASVEQRQARALAEQWSAVPKQALEDLVAAIKPASPVGRLLGSFGREAAKEARAALVEGMALSRTVETVATAIEKALSVSRNRALTIARTELMRAQRSATLATYAANSDILSGWAPICARTARTCPACYAIDGKFFELSVQFAPFHVGCRCGVLPVLREGGITIPPASEWLKQQPDSFQDQVLTPSGGALFRAGKIELRDFLRMHESKTWGASYTAGSVSQAEANAVKRR